MLASFYTDLCADSVEWCPHDPFKNIFVCGLYESNLTFSTPVQSTIIFPKLDNFLPYTQWRSYRGDGGAMPPIPPRKILKQKF